MDNQNTYNASFKYEILNEVIASINGFAFRNYGNDTPQEIKPQLDEVHDIYCKLSSEQNLGKLEEYDRRLTELRSYIFEHTPLPHK